MELSFACPSFELSLRYHEEATSKQIQSNVDFYYHQSRDNRAIGFDVTSANDRQLPLDAPHHVPELFRLCSGSLVVMWI